MSVNQKEQFSQVSNRKSGEDKILAETNYILILERQCLIPFQSFYQLFCNLLPLKQNNISPPYKKNDPNCCDHKLSAFFN